MKKKLLITGCSGFIGFHLCKSLLDDGCTIYGVDNMNDYYDFFLMYINEEITEETLTELINNYV